MKIIDQLDEAARNWNRTKNSKYKEEWYKLIKEFADGTDYFTGRNIKSCASFKPNDGKHNVIEKSKLFRNV